MTKSTKTSPRDKKAGDILSKSLEQPQTYVAINNMLQASELFSKNKPYATEVAREFALETVKERVSNQRVAIFYTDLVLKLVPEDSALAKKAKKIQQKKFPENKGLEPVYYEDLAKKLPGGSPIAKVVGDKWIDFIKNNASKQLGILKVEKAMFDNLESERFRNDCVSTWQDLMDSLNTKDFIENLANTNKRVEGLDGKKDGDLQAKLEKAVTETAVMRFKNGKAQSDSVQRQYKILYIAAQYNGEDKKLHDEISDLLLEKIKEGRFDTSQEQDLNKLYAKHKKLGTDPGASPRPPYYGNTPRPPSPN